MSGLELRQNNERLKSWRRHLFLFQVYNECFMWRVGLSRYLLCFVLIDLQTQTFQWTRHSRDCGTEKMCSLAQTMQDKARLLMRRKMFYQILFIELYQLTETFTITGLDNGPEGWVGNDKNCLSVNRALKREMGNKNSQHNLDYPNTSHFTVEFDSREGLLLQSVGFSRR